MLRIKHPDIGRAYHYKHPGKSKMEFHYFFRKPVFPVVGNIEGYFIGAKTVRGLGRQLAEIQLKEKGYYNLVDFTGEGWTLHIPEMVISPLTAKKRWTKLEIIKLFNERANNELWGGEQYSEKSLPAKRLGRIISDLAAIPAEFAKNQKTNCGRPEAKRKR
ncbi:MAG: hypothetical protein LC633_05260 [Desulfobulbaceae bacterium]|nr:hypothetical protein [Desulfobulbaceae bacterium]